MASSDFERLVGLGMIDRSGRPTPKGNDTVGMNEKYPGMMKIIQQHGKPQLVESDEKDAQ